MIYLKYRTIIPILLLLSLILIVSLILGNFYKSSFEGFTGGEQPGLLVVNNYDYTRQFPREQITDNKTI